MMIKLPAEALLRGSCSDGRCCSFDTRKKSRQSRRVQAASCSQNANGKPERRVVVTGMGVVSCLGHDPDEFYNNLLEGKSGVTPIESFPCDDYSTRFAGEIKGFQCNGYVSKKNERRMDNCIKYTMVAGKKALQSAGFSLEPGSLDGLDLSKCGILIGTAMGGMQTFTSAVEDLTLKGFRRMNPFCIPFAITNMSGALLAMDLGFMGPNYSISTACATGNYCILSAADHIRNGDADVMLAGGADAAIIPSGIGGFIACRALSQRNEEPHRASRPWDRNRDGFVMGEGAGVLVLEELEHAQTRGAPILAEFLGGSCTCDAHHMTEPQPQGRGVRLCIEKSLEQAGVSPEEVNYVNAHATSTQAGDLAEYRAIRAAIPGSDVRINGTKSMIGHLLGAAGAVEAIATIQAIRTGLLHPTINVEDPEDEIDMGVIVGAEKQAMDVNIALSNSFGFGGHNSSILFRAFK
ncbi:g5292 [Coccomyxa elongata]